jgi:hypothetical protein
MPINRRKVLLVIPLLTGVAEASSQPRLTNFFFGALREVSPGVFEYLESTRRLPRKLKNTGFRWGIGFDNPDGAQLEWHELVTLPAPLREVSGMLHRTSTTKIRTKTGRSSERSLVDDFWFDEGDPLGIHKLELIVNDRRRFSVDFEVVAAE